MFRRIRILIRILMGSAVGYCAGHTLYVMWQYHRYPALYMVQSAPWYTSILLSLGLTIVFCLLMMCMDWGIGLCIRAKERKEDFYGKN